MQKLMPIEPGCMAMVIDSEEPANQGKIVQVLSFMDACYSTGPRWKVDTLLTWHLHYVDAFGTKRVRKLLYPEAWEKNLMRIDGYQEDEEIKQEEVKQTPELV